MGVFGVILRSGMVPVEVKEELGRSSRLDAYEVKEERPPCELDCEALGVEGEKGMRLGVVAPVPEPPTLL